MNAFFREGKCRMWEEKNRHTSPRAGGGGGEGTLGIKRKKKFPGGHGKQDPARSRGCKKKNKIPLQKRG